MLCWLCFLPLFSECYGIVILLLNLFGFLFLLFLIENGVWVSPEGVRFHGFGFRVTYKLKISTSQKKGRGSIRQYSLKHAIT